MIKEIEDIRKSARIKATRKWRNHQVTQNFKAAQKEVADEAAKEPKPIEPADVIEPERLTAGGATIFERKFLKDLRAMLEGHQNQNIVRYAISNKIKLRKCLMEKLRRLKAADAQQTTGE
jgi:hypothetical protein